MKFYFIAVKVEGSNKANMPASQQAQSIPPVLGVRSPIQFGDPVKYGMIKRIDEDPISNTEVAEVRT